MVVAGADSRGGNRSKLLGLVPAATLQDDDKVSEFALDGLKQVMAIKSRVVLPYLVPKVNDSSWQILSSSRTSCHSWAPVMICRCGV